MDDLARLTATEAAAQVRDGRITSTALVDACLRRSAAREPTVRAWAELDPGLALEAAARADRLRAEGGWLGPLHGVPVGLKDVIDTADYPTGNGSPAHAGRRPEADAAAVALLRAAGAIILGKTVTCELATHVPSVTRNPADPTRTPGGSSSGSAAAVADFHVPAALGTQTLGSMIRPAAFCGVFGFKPSFGAIPRPGVLEQSPSLDTVGVFARSVEDLALLGDALFGHDPRDPATRPRSRPGLVDTVAAPWPVPPTFALVRSDRWADLDPCQREAIDELVDILGPRVTEIEMGFAFEEGLAAARTVRVVEFARAFGVAADRAPDLMHPDLHAVVERGRAVPAVAYLDALETRRRLGRIAESVFLDHGTILTPAALGPAPKGFATTGDPHFCGLWTFLGTPALSLPLFQADGLPMAVQLVGARDDDARLLRSARLLVTELAAAGADQAPAPDPARPGPPT
jgi:Asp-tRNA(Asn)/Glu-tRNA(Gln) amidotransferase A subunit family amidase